MSGFCPRCNQTFGMYHFCPGDKITQDYQWLSNGKPSYNACQKCKQQDSYEYGYMESSNSRKCDISLDNDLQRTYYLCKKCREELKKLILDYLEK
jgi:hypothetical protein